MDSHCLCNKRQFWQPWPRTAAGLCKCLGRWRGFFNHTGSRSSPTAVTDCGFMGADLVMSLCLLPASNLRRCLHKGWHQMVGR